ncbi:MAG: hypothetical protein P8X74_12955 [Reinekea sp.]
MQKIAGAPQFLGSKEESMASTLRRYGVTDSGIYISLDSVPPRLMIFLSTAVDSEYCSHHNDPGSRS